MNSRIESAQVDMNDLYKNESNYIDLREKERDGWHKLWLYGFVSVNFIMLILIIVVVRLSKMKVRE